MVERLRGRAGKKQRARRLQAHGVRCGRCGCLGVWTKIEVSASLPLLVVDHETPLALGGSDADSNTRVVCEPCHTEITAEQFGHRQRPTIGLDGWPVPG